MKDNNRGNKLGLIAGTVLLAVSAIKWGYYLGKPNVPEMDLLRGTSAYLQQYSEQNPAEALDYTQRTLEIVARNNPNLQGISDLEKEISQISSDIQRSSNISVYLPILNSAGEKMRTIADLNTRYSPDLWEAIFTGILAIVILDYSYRQKRSQPGTK